MTDDREDADRPGAPRRQRARPAAPAQPLAGNAGAVAVQAGAAALLQVEARLDPQPVQEAGSPATTERDPMWRPAKKRPCK
jgi:hypothetical protein